jgi:flavin-dependent dehydrogenase
VLAIGDALCHFIPVFGKGMSVAAQEAVILDRLLAEDVLKRLASLPSKHHREAARRSITAERAPKISRSTEPCCYFCSCK